MSSQRKMWVANPRTFPNEEFSALCEQIGNHNYFPITPQSSIKLTAYMALLFMGVGNSEEIVNFRSDLISKDHIGFSGWHQEARSNNIQFFATGEGEVPTEFLIQPERFNKHRTVPENLTVVGLSFEELQDFLLAPAIDDVLGVYEVDIKRLQEKFGDMLILRLKAPVLTTSGIAHRRPPKARRPNAAAMSDMRALGNGLAH